MSMFCDLNVNEFLAHYSLYLSLGGITPTWAPFPYIVLLQLLQSKRFHAVLETMMPGNVYDSSCLST